MNDQKRIFLNFNFGLEKYFNSFNLNYLGVIWLNILPSGRAGCLNLAVSYLLHLGRLQVRG